MWTPAAFLWSTYLFMSKLRLMVPMCTYGTQLIRMMSQRRVIYISSEKSEEIFFLSGDAFAHVYILLFINQIFDFIRK